MPNYDFKTLSPIDFEILTRDLLQKELDVTLETFKSGRDQGVDLRHCPSTDNLLIIQCKHYASSTFSTLLSHLKNSELDKVKKLNPSRYIIATSIGLSPQEKDKIVTLFKPFIKNTGDVFGRDEFNGLLAKFPDIEKHTFKLWFSSVSIFEEISDSKVINVSRDALAKIQRNAKSYVHNKSYPEALKTLNKYNFCIIAGIPGIGKTTLAEMLLLHYLEQDYEIVKITGDISEASGRDYQNRRRVFYYDDFLGQTSLSEKFNKGEDQKLLDFISTIHHSKVSKLILTTREYILNQTKMVYEKIAREKLDAETCIIDLSKYTRLNKAEILFNHIYFSDLPDEHKGALIENRNYLEIIDHENYNPRIIDFMTEFTRIEDVPANKYMNFFKSNLENPLEIWAHAFERQLSKESRHLLLLMASLPDELFMDDLQKAFDVYHEKQASCYGFERTPNDFNNSLKELEGNFIATEKSRDKTVVKLHNPSIRDFLKHHISINSHELISIIEAAIYHEQVVLLWEPFENNSDDLQYRKFLIKNPDQLFEALHRTLNSVSCGLINTRYRDGSFYKSIWHESFEARVILVASIAKEIETEKFMSYFDQCMKLIEKQIDENQANLNDLSRLLTNLKKWKLINMTNHKTLLQKAKQYCMEGIYWVDDFRYFCEFSKMFPELVHDKDFEEMKVKFKKMASEDPDDISDGPDSYREYADYVDMFSTEFDINMSARVNELEEMAEELENEIPLEDDSGEGGYNYRSNNDYCNDADIDSIFNSLK